MDNLLPQQIPTFTWSDLHGKTLKILVSEDSGCRVVVGVDETTNNLYVLETQISNVKSRF